MEPLNTNQDFKSTMDNQTTHFGFQTVSTEKKAEKVAEVFHSVAQSYDRMNDAMSLGIHRLWKQFCIRQARVQKGHKILDLAAGTADLTIEFAKQIKKYQQGEVWHTDINPSMLAVGRDRLIDQGLLVPSIVCDAQYLPFPDHYFDTVTIAFGLRNVTDKQKALKEIHRVLKPTGKLLVLEFSKIHPLLSKPYDFWSFKILPELGGLIANDKASYQYLVESIRMHPDQETLKKMMEEAGFLTEYFNLSAGIVALHQGIRQ